MLRTLPALGMLIASCAFAQQSLFQSGDGQTAVYLRQSTASINLGDSQASLAYVHRINTQPFSWGADAYATANSGVASLFSSDKPKAPEGGGDFTVVKHYLTGDPRKHVGSPGPAKEDWLLLDVGYGRSSFYLYPANTGPSLSTQKSDFNRFRAIAAYNLFANGSLVFGAAAGAERRNNLADLQPVSLETVVVAAAAGSQSSIVTTKAGYYGNYRQYVAVPIYTDVLFYLPAKVTVPGFNNRVGVDLISRSDVAAVNRISKGGLGIFLFKRDDPLTTIGGLTATYDGSKFQFSLTAGLTSR